MSLRWSYGAVLCCKTQPKGITPCTFVQFKLGSRDDFLIPRDIAVRGSHLFVADWGGASDHWSLWDEAKYYSCALDLLR